MLIPTVIAVFQPGILLPCHSNPILLRDAGVFRLLICDKLYAMPVTSCLVELSHTYFDMLECQHVFLLVQVHHYSLLTK